MDDKKYENVALPTMEVPLIEPDSVRQLRQLASQGWGSTRIASELGIARNTVRRYLRGQDGALRQERPNARALTAEERAEALKLFDAEAGGNAAVLTEMLRERGHDVALRTVQKVTAERRRQRVASALATVRFETAPGAQMQIDFGQKMVEVGDKPVRVFFLVAVLSYSRRLFVKGFLSERQDDWLEGIACAFRHFGGVTRTILGDNARALVLEHNREAQTLRFHPGYLAFCGDWDVMPRACAPYRARTKGKTEAGVKYVKNNALAGRRFESFAALESHLETWMARADDRVHATTNERPRERYERDEASALRPLRSERLRTRSRELSRRVSNDSFVDVDTVRYSVPHRLVRAKLTVRVHESVVIIHRGSDIVATHRRCNEPGSTVRDPQHFAGLWRAVECGVEARNERDESLKQLGRSLAEYAEIIEEGAA